MTEVRKLNDEQKEEYNNKRPDESLGNKTPFEWETTFIKNDYTLKVAVLSMGYLQMLGDEWYFKYNYSHSNNALAE